MPICIRIGIFLPVYSGNSPLMTGRIAMKTFTSTERNYNRQYAAAYVVYMMAGSCFARCRSLRVFCNWYLHYAEMPRQQQYQCESQVIRATERMTCCFLEKIAALHCEVSCRHEGDDLCLDFCTGGFEGLHCLIHPDGTFQIVPVESR